MGTRIKGETDEHRVRRDALLEAEQALTEQREAVATMRRQLPPGAPVVEDYRFREGPADLDDDDPKHYLTTHFSELFHAGRDTLIVQHLMFPPDTDRACPMCSMWADGLNGVVQHVEQRAGLVVVARTQLQNLRAWGRKRGRHRLRLLSSYDNHFNPDFGVELSPERQLPAISVFRCQPDGTVFHCYTSEGSLVERHHRAMDLYTPVWNLFDLLPEGRGDWMPSHFYETSDE